MTLYHLNEPQRIFIRQWLADNPTRPLFGAYDKASRAITKIPVGRRPTAKSVAQSSPGYGVNELRPTKSFDATLHLPAGWSIYSMHDSGGNHRIGNAGESLLRALWNCWSSKSETSINFASPLGSKLHKQLLANDITLP